MADQLISVTGNEILFEAISANAVLDKNGNMFLNIEILVYSEPEHSKPYSPAEEKNKRQIEMININPGLAKGSVSVLASEAKGATRFSVKIELDGKVPGSGGKLFNKTKLKSDKLSKK